MRTVWGRRTLAVEANRRRRVKLRGELFESFSLDGAHLSADGARERPEQCFRETNQRPSARADVPQERTCGAGEFCFLERCPPQAKSDVNKRKSSLVLCKERRVLSLEISIGGGLSLLGASAGSFPEQSPPIRPPGELRAAGTQNAPTR